MVSTGSSSPRHATSKSHPRARTSGGDGAFGLALAGDGVSLMTFESMLATWLAKQRWFAGKGRTVHDLAIVADTEIVTGNPGLRHLIVCVSHGTTVDSYQLFLGLRT